MAMSPEELRELKRLTEKMKAHKKELGSEKETLAKDIYNAFATAIRSCKKDVVTISTGKVAYADGNVWAISVGSEVTEEDVNAAEIAVSIIDEHLAGIESAMGLGNSLKIVFDEGEGEEITKRFVQFRKRESETLASAPDTNEE